MIQAQAEVHYLVDDQRLRETFVIEPYICSSHTECPHGRAFVFIEFHRQRNIDTALINNRRTFAVSHFPVRIAFCHSIIRFSEIFGFEHDLGI